MSTSSVKVRVSEFVTSSKRQLEESARRCDLLSGELARKLRGLPQELKDRFVSYREETGALVLSLTGLLEGYARYVSNLAHRADSDDDGYLSPEDAQALPGDLQDSFRACLWNARPADDERALEARPRDLTPPALRAAAGQDGLAYADAVRRATRAMILREDSPGCARAQMRDALEEQGGCSEARLDLVLKRDLEEGTLELLPDAGRHAWLFRVCLAPSSELSGTPFYVEVDRASGRAHLAAAA